MYFIFLAVESYNVSTPYEKVDITACYLIKVPLTPKYYFC